MSLDFAKTFEALTGNPPFPWQTALYERFVSDRPDNIPQSCNLPTGLGKTSVIAIWLIALANFPDKMPRRLVYVVNRRTVVDQTTEEVEKYTQNILKHPEVLEALHAFHFKSPAVPHRHSPFAISTLRGQYADNGDWSNDPSRPTVICGTVDMIGSRLLFSGYGVGLKARPLHAGFLGQDALLVHDEAHLEPAFQKLILKIEAEQGLEPEVPWPKFRVMELTATSKTANPFKLEQADYANPIVDQRLNAAKKFHLHALADAKKPAKEMLAKAIEYKDGGRAVLIFAYSVETVLEIADALSKHTPHVATLTGTMRGKERDELVEKPVFARFLPKLPGNAAVGTVYLVCTSAGEVGVNISADHLICDLSTFESMAQRLGRVNRFGEFPDCEVHCLHPKEKDWDEKHPLTVPRQKTLALLRPLEGKNVSPHALGELPLEDRIAAFAPEPVILPATDILFDAWALTSIKGKLPGRPPVEPYLHGIPNDGQQPETNVAWREEVEWLSGNDFTEDRVEVLAAYPLQPRELLKEPSYRAFDKLKKIAERHPNHSAWLVSDEGDVRVVELSFFQDKGNKDEIEKITVLLDPRSGGLSENGMLDGTSTAADDVSETADRCRRQGDAEPLPGLHEVYKVVMEESEDEDEDADENVWRWFVRKNTGETTGKRREPITLAHHVGDVERELKRIIARLPVEALRPCFEIAAKYHDDGKKRTNFQRMLGNNNPNEFWAKSGSRKGTRLAERYRHEFGSLREVSQAEEFKQLSLEQQELVLHLIATHHGRARPHFPPEEAFDPASTQEADCALASTVPRRFGLLQRKYGRWGLAYLESLLRAADWEASDHPSDLKEGQS